MNEPLLVTLFDSKNHLGKQPPLAFVWGYWEHNVYLGSVETCKILFKDVPLNQEIKQITTTHVFKHLRLSVSKEN